jgi:HEAT repeat protein
MMIHIALLLLLQGPTLDSASPKERQAAVEAMAKPGNAPAVPALAAALKKEPRSEIRSAIVEALAKIRDKSVVPVLADTLATDLHKDVRLSAVSAFERLYIPPGESGAVRSVFNRVKGAITGPDRPVVGEEVAVDPQAKNALTDAMSKDTEPAVRAAAARALGSLKSQDKTSALIAALENPQNREAEDVRYEIVQSLGMIRDSAAGPTLRKTLGDPSKRIVGEAVTSLGLVGYREARPDLEGLLRQDASLKIFAVRIERDRDLRRKALDALALLADPASKPLFESLLADPDDHTREMAAEGLARLKFTSPTLKDRFDTEKKPSVKVALAFTLAMGGQINYIGEIANALGTGQNDQAEAYLYELGKFENRLAELHPFLKSANPKVRAGMVRVLASIGDPSSRPLIEGLKSDLNDEVVREALAAQRRYNAR